MQPAIIISILFVLVLFYFTLFRPWQLRWGATVTEIIRPMPGDDCLAGFYWIEERGKTLHLHGLILKAAFQGKGIGTAVIRMLVESYQGQVKAIELGVHQSNARAKKLYERLGFEVVKYRHDLGYFIMQRPILPLPDST